MPLVELALGIMLLPLHQQQQAKGHTTADPSSSSTNNTILNQQNQQQQQGQQQKGSQASDRAYERIKGHWQALLQVLSRSLVSCLAICHSERAAAAAGAAGGGQLADSAVAALAAGSRSLLGGATAMASTAAGAARAMGDVAAIAEGGLHEWDEGQEVGTVAWDMASVNVLLLALRLVDAVPSDWCTRAAVPPAVANAAVVAALDEAVAWRVPQLRPAAMKVLQLLRPDALLLLQQAERTHRAIAAGEEVVTAVGQLARQLNHGQHQQQQLENDKSENKRGVAVVREWLLLLKAAILGLGFSHAADVRLLQAALQGLALCSEAAASSSSSTGSTKLLGAVAAAPAAAAGGGWDLVCGQLLIQLLCHEQTSVQQLIYQLLSSALEDGNSSSSSNSGRSSASSAAASKRVHAVVQLLCQPLVLEYLVVEGLGSSSTRAAAVAVLQGLLLQGGREQAVAAAAVHWAGWLSCFQGEATAGPLVEAWQVAAERAVADGVPVNIPAGDGGWQQVGGRVLRLFSCQAGVRRRAGQGLLRDIGALPAEEEQQQQHEQEWSFTTGFSPSKKSRGSKLTKQEGSLKELEDPFRGLLESSSSRSSRHKSSDLLTDCPVHLARRFSPSDVRNLLGVVHNRGLAPELRRAAAEELLHLVVVPELREMLLEEWQLKGLWDIVVPQQW